tara:strand:+ start:516 stop:629 length:114 start_codon:yes stop_codon:yes gene_type:complete
VWRNSGKSQKLNRETRAQKKKMMQERESPSRKKEKSK